MNAPWLWIPLALLSAFFAALVAVFGKLGLGKLDVVTSTAARAAVMFVVILIAALVTGSVWKFNQIQGREGWLIVLAGVAGALSWLFYFWALKSGKASGVGAMDRLSVVFLVILAAVFLGEKFGWKSGVGSAMIVAGAVLVSLQK